MVTNPLRKKWWVAWAGSSWPSSLALHLVDLVSRRPRPRRTGRGDPQGGSIQHGAGCGAFVIAVLAGVAGMAMFVINLLA